MTVAVPDRTAPPPPWRPPSDPHPLTQAASQSLGLCYHGNFSLSFVDDEHDVGDDVADADDIRTILELAEQCSFEISVKDCADTTQDMYPTEVSPSPTPCEEPTATYQSCRFTAGVKRKLDFDSYEARSGGPAQPENGEVEGTDERASSEYQDRQRMLEVSLCKMRRMEDPETSLRRCVLINNMTVKLKQELDHQDKHCRTMLPKKRHILRRTDTTTISPGGMGSLTQQSPCCRQENHAGDKFPSRTWDTADACEPMATPPLSSCRGQEEVPREQLLACDTAGLTTPGEGLPNNGSVTESEATGDTTPSIFGDIDSVFQSLLSCLGEPM
ncbi:uncharacterized protein LOC110975253 [Acanthaster planci]|uniref:Uncharacterized protein LOC110975253 n=1 Tax=Acanthaster planci TaxID=133434 RepID=A0A8B7XST9_ACAPL|nr:uncharacterized protein LOC110975253 [Acanthaster planci]XP_022083272.1 uncharacterized protein LOC110975253 [Acanthaster planci]